MCQNCPRLLYVIQVHAVPLYSACLSVLLMRQTSPDLGCQQFALTASPAELKDPFSVGVVNGTGVIEGADLRNFLRDKLRRCFVKKGVRIRFQNNQSLRILTHVAPLNPQKSFYPSECLSRRIACCKGLHRGRTVPLKTVLRPSCIASAA